MPKQHPHLTYLPHLSLSLSPPCSRALHSAPAKPEPESVFFAVSAHAHAHAALQGRQTDKPTNNPTNVRHKDERTNVRETHTSLSPCINACMHACMHTYIHAGTQPSHVGSTQTRAVARHSAARGGQLKSRTLGCLPCVGAGSGWALTVVCYGVGQETFWWMMRRCGGRGRNCSCVRVVCGVGRQTNRQASSVGAFDFLSLSSVSVV
ncbi:hypothetical protein BC567DRAFT_14797 [Phyllosticta citribraziliensis]